MRALVFGATGFIGMNLVERLLKDRHEVDGVSRTKTSNRKRSGYKHILLDITDKDEFEKLSSRYDVVFNTAAYIPSHMQALEEVERCFAVNSLGTLHILEYINTTTIPIFIQSSSASVYGSPNKLPVRENDQVFPSNVYAVSKLTAEYYCSMFKNITKTLISILRYGSVFGTGCHQGTVLPLLVQKAKNNEGITLIGHGERSQDFVYVDDVVNANILAAEYKKSGIYNIGGGREIAMKELAQTIIDLASSKSKIHYAPGSENFRMHLDISKAKKELGYNPKFDLKQGIRAYIKSV